MDQTQADTQSPPHPVVPIEARCLHCHFVLSPGQVQTCQRSSGAAPALLSMLLPGLGIMALGAVRVGLAWLGLFFGAGVLFGDHAFAIVIKFCCVGHTFILARDHVRCPLCNQWVRVLGGAAASA